MHDLLIAAIFLAIGLVLIIFRKGIGRAFCSYGRANWKQMTKGKTDMSHFYPEDKAPFVFCSVGIFFIVLATAIIAKTFKFM